MRVRVQKYYTHGKHSDPVIAQQEVERLSEKHPDRTYVLLRNMRATYYSRYIVAQVKTVEVDLPTPEELGAPLPERSQFATPEDFAHERKRWHVFIQSKQKHALGVLSEKLNP